MRGIASTDIHFWSWIYMLSFSNTQRCVFIYTYIFSIIILCVMRSQNRKWPLYILPARSKILYTRTIFPRSCWSEIHILILLFCIESFAVYFFVLSKKVYNMFLFVTVLPASPLVVLVHISFKRAICKILCVFYTQTEHTYIP